VIPIAETDHRRLLWQAPCPAKTAA